MLKKILLQKQPNPPKKSSWVIVGAVVGGMVTITGIILGVTKWKQTKRAKQQINEDLMAYPLDESVAEREVVMNEDVDSLGETIKEEVEKVEEVEEEVEEIEEIEERK